VGAALGAAAVAFVAVTYPWQVWAAVEVGHGWAVLGRDSFRRIVGLRALAMWRRGWVYGRQWQPAMTVTGLDRVDAAGRQTLPRLRRVRCLDHVDVVQIRALLGQRFAEWEAAGPMLAHVFGATGFEVLRGDDRRLTLLLKRGRRGRSWDRDGRTLAG
jgi:S-DNA-T family DNA segregation ATPase FtsK/SpoIIIE